MDPGRVPLTGKDVGGLPSDIAEQDVGVEPLLERLAFQSGRLERFSESADGVGEDVVQHDDVQATDVSDTPRDRPSGASTSPVGVSDQVAQGDHRTIGRRVAQSTRFSYRLD